MNKVFIGLIALGVLCITGSAHAQGIFNPQTNASQLTTGTLPSGRLTGAYTGVTGLGTVASPSFSGTTTLGSVSGDSLVINSLGVSIPNNLNFDSNTLFLDAANNRVGIGTTTPAFKLSVDGGGFAVGTAGGSFLHANGIDMAFNRNVDTGALFTSSAHAYQWHRNQSTTAASDYLALQVYNSSGSQITANAVVINGAGNVGIGTTSPANTLSVSGTGATFNTTFASPGNGLGGVGIGYNTTGHYGTIDAARWGTNNDNLILQGAVSNGNVGIGTTSPTGKLQVSTANGVINTEIGGAAIYTTNAQAADIGGKLMLGGVATSFANGFTFAGMKGAAENGTASNYSGYLALFTSTSDGTITERMRINSTGAITMPSLVSSSAAQTGTMCWSTGTGNITVDTTTTCLSSSAQFKHDIKPLLGSLERVLAMRPVSYVYNDEQFTPGEQIGFVAEDMEVVNERLVSRNAEGRPRSVRYQQLTAELVGAIQAQQLDIAALKARKWCFAGWCL